MPGRIKTANRFLDESDFAGEQLGIVADEEPAVNDQTQTRQFKSWFGNSKVVDDAGKPLVVYRGAPFE